MDDPSTAAAHDPRVATFLDVLGRVPPAEAEAALSRTGIAPQPAHVEPVLRSLAASPAAAVKFFRWSGLHIKHDPAAWDLMVDVLGRNALFEAMWDAIRSMRRERAISPHTFALAFRSYCAAAPARVKEAVMSFEVMERYGLNPDAASLNDLLSAICFVAARPADAADVFDRVKARVAPDARTFAVLLSAWESTGDAVRAKSTFGEMVVRIGWDPANVPAYDAFLTTLIRASQADEALKFLRVMKSKGCLPSRDFFAAALDTLCHSKDAANALALWDVVADDSIPDTTMFNAMIKLLCGSGDVDNAYRLLDQMPFHGVFDNALAYDTIFACLLVNRRVHEAERFFIEMRKNELLPSLANCAAAIRLFFDEYDPVTAMGVWSYLMQDRVKPDDQCANELLVGLRDLGRLSEVRRYTDNFVDLGVEILPSTMDKLKTAFHKAGKHEAYDRIMRRLKQR